MITSVENPRVKEVLRLRKGRERRRAGLFVAEGRREVARALAAGLVVRSVYFAPDLIAPDLIAPELIAPELPPDLIAPPESIAPASVADWPGSEEVSARVLARMSYRADPEGVLAVVEIPHRPLPDGATLLLVAVGIEKPGNLGAMARTADVAGADALLVADANVDPWNPNAIRASTGAVFTLPIIDATRDQIAALPHRKIAAVLGAGRLHTDADYTDPTAFLIGAEDEGLSAEWRTVADAEVEIPMQGAAADSLNASAAAAVLLFEAVRQRSGR